MRNPILKLFAEILVPRKFQTTVLHVAPLLYHEIIIVFPQFEEPFLKRSCLSLCRSLPKAKREAKRRKISFRQAKEAGPVTKKPLLDQEDNPLVSRSIKASILLCCG